MKRPKPLTKRLAVQIEVTVGFDLRVPLGADQKACEEAVQAAREALEYGWLKNTPAGYVAHVWQQAAWDEAGEEVVMDELNRDEPS